MRQVLLPAPALVVPGVDWTTHDLGTWTETDSEGAADVGMSLGETSTFDLAGVTYRATSARTAWMLDAAVSRPAGKSVFLVELAVATFDSGAGNHSLCLHLQDGSGTAANGLRVIWRHNGASHGIQMATDAWGALTIATVTGTPAALRGVFLFDATDKPIACAGCLVDADGNPMTHAAEEPNGAPGTWSGTPTNTLALVADEAGTTARLYDGVVLRTAWT